MTGFTVNYDKTVIYRIGSLKNSNISFTTRRVVAWTAEPINVLGVWISHDKEEIISLNYKPILDKMAATLKVWGKRSLSLLGKVLIINSLIASLFVYKMTVLPMIPEYLISGIRKEIEKFLWNGARPKIPYDTLCRSKSNGGLGLVDLSIKDKALKVTWLQILYKECKLANIAYENMACEMRDLVWSCNLFPVDVKVLTENIFWQQALMAWFEFKFIKDEQRDIAHKQILWYNSEIRIENSPFFWSKPFQKGLVYIAQLYKNNVLKSFRDINSEFGLNVIEYNSIISAIPRK